MTAAAETPTRKGSEAAAEAARRRTFAVISHPDAGKSTLTEALALHAAAITSAGAVHGKGDRRGVTSDWMEMERARGISITSAALRIDYADRVLNLLDTPGHADFSEDTYRVLAAVDSAIMLLDSAKGLEPQTLKLFDVCRARKIPVVTFVNKWDRPGREPLELLDEIEQRIGLRPTPLNWPVGIAGDFRGLIDRTTGRYTKLHRTPGGATRAEEEPMDAERAAEVEGAAWEQAQEEIELLGEIGADFDEESFLAGESSPVLFGAALPNFGVAALLESLVRLAPAPSAQRDTSGEPRPVEAPFSGLVFKMQANMDKQHRDRMAFVRVCSGRFDRGMVLTHAATGRPFATKYSQAVFGSERQTIDTAYPGDVIALVNANALRVGDTLFDGDPVEFPPIPSFAPEHFAVARAVDSGRYKQFRRGIEQLDTEGVVQVLVSDVRGEQAPVLAAVGPLQFDVVRHRMEHEFRAPIELSHLDYNLARRTDAASAPVLHGLSGAEVLSRRLDGDLLVLVHNKWRLRVIERDHPDLVLEPLLAGGVEEPG
ncbi:peptide chain release factor 3 [Marinitenerispora sediminis]|uniref:Peptide chain release factor 3 n=1 Tax=Marinitenerispora sediminis TaxID=1931232 RepID=A0A368T0L1_9ACTN|nr:peptide chain release factor 3 [Marinitenerispora sediminis]RCV50269.1 peptide chain release factor 3 [Marinitenerispora sediminis]RCV50478.1 peptide chain release factor 3 [Marinitenerispora sediminis]RCV52841.1 peptide chain release factor 3 [Marinitenerispora sediminis]